MSSHFAHHGFGPNSLRVVDVNLTDEQREDVVVDQLGKLEGRGHEVIRASRHPDASRQPSHHSSQAAERASGLYLELLS